jgi:hypothetical protein
MPHERLARKESRAAHGADAGAASGRCRQEAQAVPSQDLGFFFFPVFDSADANHAGIGSSQTCP